MIYTLKNQDAEFALPLLEFASYTSNGYLFKVTSDYNSESVYFKEPTIVGENIRFTKFEFDFEIPAGQYKYEVYNYDKTQPAPTDETGLTLNAVGILIVKETETNDIYL